MHSTVLLALLLGVSAGKPVPTPTQPCLALLFSSGQQSGGAYAASFSATNVVDVDLTAVFPPAAVARLTGVHVVELRVYAPTGNLYQSFSIPVSLPGKQSPPVRLDSHPEPVAVRTLVTISTDTGKVFSAKATLPVAGTPILNNGLYGTWAAETLFDGADSQCGPRTPFAITP